MNEFLITDIRLGTGTTQDQNYVLLLQKKDGTNWLYPLKNELTKQEIEILKSRRDGNNPLGIAKFKRVKTKKGECLHLEELGL